MKIWIGTDMEGIAGVVDREHTHRTGREHDRARGWMTDEVNAAVAGCFAGVDESFNAAMLVGYHARAGHHPGVLDHTSWSQTVSEVSLNGQPVGEAELNAAYVGELGIPVLLVSGDTIELRFHHPMYTDLAAMVPGCRKTGEWSAAFTGASFLEAFGAFTAMCGVTGIAHYQHQ